MNAAEAKTAAKPASRQQTPSGQPRRKRTATLVLSGGAPNSPLVTGALTEIYLAGKTFHDIHTSGAGGLIGLGLVAPRGMETPQAFELGLTAAISDPIFPFCPLPFKTFFKPGPFTAIFQRWGRRLLWPGPFLGPENASRRLYNDLVQMWTAMMTPTWISFSSKGLSQPYPFLDEVVDFDKLKAFKGDFFLNAYNISEQRMEQFTKEDLDVQHFKAALAYPFIYEPVEIDGKHYSEGADRDPLNLPQAHHRASKRVKERGEEHTMLVIDVLGSMYQALIRVPRNLVDAYGIQIMTPVVALAQKNLEHFKDTMHKGEYELSEMRFDIEPDRLAYTTDWSYDNMSYLWEVGRETGKAWVEAHGGKLPDREPGSANPV